jgi:A/G-specific adenine glycosylase
MPATPDSTLALDRDRLDAVRRALPRWFEQAGRSLPWRATRDPYHVLVAEVLAQQTQADRAATAFGLFLGEFPTVEALAAASPAAVLRAWQGLGYNRRALALRSAAQAVVAAGGWPKTVESLMRLPGVGPYTARAVACFAYGQDAAPVDTNVARVLARSLLGADPASLSPSKRQRLADAALPEGNAWTWSSALMDLGASHCRSKPRCEGCPLMASCRWHALGPLAPLPTPRRSQPFASSDRRWRGAVVRVLAAHPDGLTEARLAEAVDTAAAGRPEGWFEELLGRLLAEGLIGRAEDGRYTLPS